MNGYEEKQARRRDRLKAAAEKARGEASASFRSSRELLDPIPPGQPVLVGHHSERGHRRTLDRADRALRRGMDAAERAEDLERRAASVGSGGVSSDDPEAIEKLRRQVVALEAEREARKQLNRLHRKGGWDAVAEVVGAETAADLKIAASYTADDKPTPAYVLTNLGANIRRIEARIADLEVQRDRPSDGRKTCGTYAGVAARLVEDPEDNRTILYLDGRVDRADFQQLRSLGWNRSPSRDAGGEAAFCRKLTPVAWSIGVRLLEEA